MSTIAPTTIRLGCPADMVEAVPYLVGHKPGNSIVAVLLADGRVTGTGRLDYTDAEEFAQAIPITRMAAGATDVFLIAYPPTGTADAETVLQRLSRRFGEHGLGTLGTAVVPVDGAPAPAAGRVSAAFVHAGRAPLPNREAVVAAIDCDPTAWARTVAEELHSTSDSLHAELATPAGRLDVEDAIYRYLTGTDETTRLPDANTHARWVLGASTPKVREPIMFRLMQQPQLMPRALSRLTDLVRNSPRPQSADLAALLAAVAWLAGDGLTARTAADRAMTDEPQTTLAYLVSKAVSQGTHPQIFADLINSQRLDQLRHDQPGH